MSIKIRYLSLGAALAYGLAMPSLSPLRAQVIADSVSGLNLGTIVNDPNVTPPDNPGLPDITYYITGGTQSGNNLFHSFAEFDVGSGEHAAFENLSGIDNIIARVTSGNGTFVSGMVSSPSNLWMISPNGITLRDGAQFVAPRLALTTANYMLFDDENQRFDSVGGPVPNLLTAHPQKFGFIGSSTNIDFSISGIVDLSDTYSSHRILAARNFSISDASFGGGQGLAVVAANTNVEIGISTEALATLRPQNPYSFITNHPDAGSKVSAIKQMSDSQNGNLELWSLGGNIEIVDSRFGNSYFAENKAIGELFLFAEDISLKNSSFNFSPYDMQEAEISAKNLTIHDTEFMKGYFSDHGRNALHLRFYANEYLDITNMRYLNHSLFSAPESFIWSDGKLLIDRLDFASLPQTTIPIEPEHNLMLFLYGKQLLEIENSNLSLSTMAEVLPSGFGSDLPRPHQQKSSSYFYFHSDGLLSINSSFIDISTNFNLQRYINAGRLDFSYRGALDREVGGISLYAQDIWLKSQDNIPTKILAERTISSTTGGKIHIQAENDLYIDGEGTGVFMQVGRDDQAAIEGIKGSIRASYLENEPGLNYANAYSNVGAITIAAENFYLQNGATIEASTVGLGTAGNLSINASNYSQNASTVSTSTTSFGNAGSISIYANAAVNMSDATVSSQSLMNAVGAAGSVSIAGNTLQLSNANISTTSNEHASANSTANIALTARNGDIELTNTTVSGDSTGAVKAGSITLTGNAYTQRGGSVTSTSSGTGDAGSITVTGNNGSLNSFALLDGGDIKASTSGSGNAGAITIANNGNVEIAGTNNDKAEISVSAEGATSGTIQPLVIAGSNITLTDARISATTTANTAHNTVADIRLQTTGNVTLDDSDITTETKGATKAGNISIGSAEQPVANLTLQGDSNIESSTTGSAAAGTIDIHASNEVTLQGGRPSDTTAETASLARAISASNGGMEPAIASNGSGAGNGGAGSVSITTNTLTLNNAQITTSAEGTNGGNIILNVTDSLQLNHGLIAANTKGTGNTADLTAGSILLNQNRAATRSVALLNGSAITANAEGFANGGEVRLNSENLFTSWDSGINANSERGVTGVVDTTAPAFDESGLVEELQIPLLDATDLLSRNCDTAGQRSSFVQRHALRNRQPTDFVPVKVPMRPTQVANSDKTTDQVWVVTNGSALTADNELCNRAFLQSSL